MPAAGLVDPIADPRWGELLLRAPESSVFHHAGWLTLLRETYGYRTTACCLTAADGRLVAGLPVAAVASRITGRRLVAVPFADVCPPVVAEDAPRAAAAALATALGELQRASGAPLEVRGTGAVLNRAAAGDRFHHHVLPLERDPEAVQARFSKSQVMRGVRRAEREGLGSEIRTDRAALATFYRLHTETRHRLGVPTQPRRFILGLSDLFDQGLGFVLLVRLRERAVAAAVFLVFRDVLTYKYGASDARYLAARPNNLLFMHAIDWGCRHGFRALDFGRTHWRQAGLRRFKLAWGAEERELRYRVLGGPLQAARDRSAERVLAAVIRRSPPVTGRLIGELLYRHAG